MIKSNLGVEPKDKTFLTSADILVNKDDDKLFTDRMNTAISEEGGDLYSKYRKLQRMYDDLVNKNKDLECYIMNELNG